MFPYNKVIIYYFSGTGNSKNVASWISDIASGHDIPATIHNIADIDRLKTEIPPSGALVIFVSPIHGFNYPPVMLNFIVRFPRGDNHIVLMNTRAGMLLGKFITPGLTGIAFYFSALVLKLKGYAVKGMIPVDLPSNWISIHPGLNAGAVKYLNEKNKERVGKHAEKIISGKNDFVALREIIQDVAIAPISLAYYLIGRFFFAKTFYASADCNNCNICIKGCPVKAIIKKGDRPYWTFKCESCMKCMGNCPQKAIETAHGFIIGLLFFNSLLLTPLFFNYFKLFFFPVQSKVLMFILENAILFLSLALLYRVAHYLMRFRVFERLMVYSSLTKYKWWGRRYKAPKHD